jgi:hypothetical protein
MFLISLAMRPAAAVYNWCQRWLPSNRLVTLLRTRRGYRWGVPAVLLGALYFVVGIGCYGAVRLGHTEWLYLGMLVFWWTALKLAVHGVDRHHPSPHRPRPREPRRPRRHPQRTPHRPRRRSNRADAHTVAERRPHYPATYGTPCSRSERHRPTALLNSERPPRAITPNMQLLGGPIRPDSYSMPHSLRMSTAPEWRWDWSSDGIFLRKRFSLRTRRRSSPASGRPECRLRDLDRGID